MGASDTRVSRSAEATTQAAVSVRGGGPAPEEPGGDVQAGTGQREGDTVVHAGSTGGHEVRHDGGEAGRGEPDRAACREHLGGEQAGKHDSRGGRRRVDQAHRQRRPGVGADLACDPDDRCRDDVPQRRVVRDPDTQIFSRVRSSLQRPPDDRDPFVGTEVVVELRKPPVDDRGGVEEVGALVATDEEGLAKGQVRAHAEAEQGGRDQQPDGRARSTATASTDRLIA